MAIFLDGGEVAKLEVPLPIILTNEVIQYEKYYNRQIDNVKSGGTFGLAEIIMFGSELSSSKKAELLLHLRDMKLQEDLEFFWYTKENSAYSPPGTNDVSLIGPFKKSTIRDFDKKN